MFCVSVKGTKSLYISFNCNSLKKLLKQPKKLTCYTCCLVILDLNIYCYLCYILYIYIFYKFIYYIYLYTCITYILFLFIHVYICIYIYFIYCLTHTHTCTYSTHILLRKVSKRILCHAEPN